jgi:predicted transcriptional regulator
MPRLIEEKEKKPMGAFEAFLDSRDLTFFQLSRKSGVAETTLARIRNGQSIRRGTVRKLHKFLRVERQIVLGLLKQDGVIVK